MEPEKHNGDDTTRAGTGSQFKVVGGAWKLTQSPSLLDTLHDLVQHYERDDASHTASVQANQSGTVFVFELGSVGSGCHGVKDGQAGSMGWKGCG